MLNRTKATLIALLLNPCLLWAVSLQVDIKGVNPELEKNIRSDLFLQQATTEEKLTSTRIKNLYTRAEEQISATLQAKGYYHSTIHSELQKQDGATDEQDKWTAIFNIELGKPTKIQHVEIEVIGSGKDNPKLKPFLVVPKLQTGKILVHEDYEDTKDQLLSNFNAAGYLQAEFAQSVIAVDRANYSANIKLVVNTGPQYTFGKITFYDAEYPDDFLIRFAPFKPGDPYSLAKLMEFQNNLEAGDLFNKIRFDPLNDLEDPNNTVVPIQVRLNNKPKNRYTGSIGYGTDTGVRGSLGWLHRRMSTPGHKVLSNIYASQVRSNARINYIIPGSHPATDKYVFGVLGQIETFEELYSRKAEISASKIFKRGRLETTYGIWYFTETFRLVHAFPYENKKYLLPTAKWVWIDSHPNDDFEFGTRFDLKIRAGAQCLFSDTSVAQIEANGKKLFPITKKSRLLIRGSAGAVATKDFISVPPSLRFYTGGEDTVRGYAYNSLGPLAVPSDKDSNTGGRYLLVGSVEYEHKIYQNISGVIFFDAGNTSLTTNIPLAFGTGVGIRYKTPIGNFRLDLAKPLNTLANKHWRVHMNFGTDL